MDPSRIEDLKELTARLKHAVGSEKQWIERTISSICNESGMVRSMRESLLKEARNGRRDNMKDIEEYARKKGL